MAILFLCYFLFIFVIGSTADDRKSKSNRDMSGDLKPPRSGSKITGEQTSPTKSSKEQMAQDSQDLATSKPKKQFKTKMSMSRRRKWPKKHKSPGPGLDPYDFNALTLDSQMKHKKPKRYKPRVPPSLVTSGPQTAGRLKAHTHYDREASKFLSRPTIPIPLRVPLLSCVLKTLSRTLKAVP